VLGDVFHDQRMQPSLNFAFASAFGFLVSHEVVFDMRHQTVDKLFGGLGLIPHTWLPRHTYRRNFTDLTPER